MIRGKQAGSGVSQAMNALVKNQIDTSKLRSKITMLKSFQHVIIDLAGPFLLRLSIRYLLTIVDMFTRWPEALALKDYSKMSPSRAFV